MKTALALALIALAALASASEWIDRPIARLDLIDGTTYLDLRIVEIEAHAIRIRHAAQEPDAEPLRIRSQLLRPETRAALGLPDPPAEFSGQYRVLQVLDHGYIVVEDIRTTGSAQALTDQIFGGRSRAEPRPPSYRYLRGRIDRAIADGAHLRVRYHRTDETYQYTDTQGARRTLHIIDLIEEAPPAP